MKNAGHNDWYKAVGSAYRLLESFVKKNYNMGLVYSHNSQGNWEDLIKGGGSMHQHQGHVSKHDHSSHQSKQEAPKPAKKPKKELQGLNWLIANF